MSGKLYCIRTCFKDAVLNIFFRFQCSGKHCAGRCRCVINMTVHCTFPSILCHRAGRTSTLARVNLDHCSEDLFKSYVCVAASNITSRLFALKPCSLCAPPALSALTQQHSLTHIARSFTGDFPGLDVFLHSCEAPCLPQVPKV